MLKALDKSINTAPILFSLFRLLFQCSIIFSNACYVLWFLRNSVRYFENLPLIYVLVIEKIIIQCVIHVVLFINWRNLSFFENTRIFAHLYRFIKNICQMFGVYLSILLKTFVGISPVIVDLFMGKTLIVFFSSSLSITSSKTKEFSAACVRLFNVLYTLKVSETFHNF